MKLKFRLPFQCGLAAAAVLLTGSTGYADSILRSAGNFALLGGTGITSTGTAGTTITNGNVGLSPAATSNITGFLPAVVINGAIVATGPVTAQARLDLIKAQAGLAGMPSNANMSTVDLGGKTLEPGVYTFNSEANLNGNLVLDDNQINAKGGPGGSDWSGGLMFDRAGRVVSIEKLSFNYSGRKNRVTDLARGVVKGEASANATTIQWRSN